MTESSGYGIAGGEPYPDDSVMTAVLALSRRTITDDDGHERKVLVTECKRCRSGGGSPPLSVEDAVAAAAELGAEEFRRLLRWMERGRRGATELDRAWRAYLRVPPEERREVAERLSGMQ